MYTYRQQALPRVVIHRTQVAKKKWKLRARFSPTKENRVHQTKISTKTDISIKPFVYQFVFYIFFPQYLLLIGHLETFL